MRKITTSQETEVVANSSPAKVVRVYSFFPVDKADCPCAKLILEWQRKLGQATEKERRELIEKTPFLTCPRDKVKMHRFEILCKRCSQRQGYVWATDATLKDWCDFHYVQWTPGDFWRGCFTPHISPVTEELCLECCCGNDTRDFRANVTLSQTMANKIEFQNAIGRQYGTKHAKFAVQVVR